ncbi:MAG: phenylalanine--tRNA ligase subunit beta [Muribaculaceae bacterium]|nr:phenylalanine--tRNA ligase subunit beta [Muribaculaceae bacterium]
MNISYNWLKQYIDFDLTPDQLAEVLTSVGLETGSVEEVESIRGGLRGIVVGKVLTCDEHPNSDHLHITTVDLGGGHIEQIVCGAPNVAAGQTVIVATVGTTLYDGDKEFQIKKSKIRGVESMGMICAEDEIGVGHSHDGIIVITDEVAPGTPAADYYNLRSDYMLEVDLTPNRIDAASHYGVARDLKAWLDTHATPAALRRPSVGAFHADRPDGAVTVEVEATDSCTRYAGVTIRGVKVAESPQWLKDRLTAIGLNPHNNLVDITNYILHSFCQPMHCFDLAKVTGEKIIVKNAVEGATFTTLDGVEHKLDSRDLMICNTREPMCIAGVMGGLESGVTEATTDIFLESACFNPTSVRKTARRHGISSDSSFRFERGVDPNGVMYALKLAALLVKEIAGGEICGEPVDIYPAPVAPYPVDLSYSYTDSLIGKQIPHETIDAIIRSLEIEIAGRDGDDTLRLLVPTYRVDVQRPCDVVEDILRIYGYNNVEISDRVHSTLSYKTVTDSSDSLRRLISEQLTACGFNEILNNSLTAERYYADNATWPLDNCVRLLNPLSQDLSVMRRTLLYGGLESIEHNINRKTSDLMMYEFGNVYRFNPDAGLNPEKPLAPYSEGARLALWMTGNSRTAAWNHAAEEVTFFDLKATVANILARLGVSPRELQLQTLPAGNIYAAALAITTRSGKQLGTMGLLAKSLLKQMGIKQPVLFAELDWDAILKLALKKKISFTPLPKTMPVTRDLALLLDKTVTFQQVEQIVRDSEKRLLKDICLFDVYEGDKLPEGKKSYAISITLQDDEKTLQDKAIDATMSRIIQNLTRQLNAELR